MLHRKVAIVGIGQAPGGKATGYSSIELSAIAAREAMEDAGVGTKDVDGLITSTSMSEPHHLYAVVLAEYLGVRPRLSGALQLGGASFSANVIRAAACVSAGLCHTVLITDADNRLTQLRRADKRSGDLATMVYGIEQFEEAFGVAAPQRYALVAQRHMHRYGTTGEQLAAIAVASRKHAVMAPGAQMQRPVSIADVLASPIVSSPLHKLDCCLVSDWGGAVIVTTAERARDTKKVPIYLLGVGEAHRAFHLTQAGEITTSPAVLSGQQAFGMAGVSPLDIDLAELYDCFTITVLVELEDLGFCQKGEGGHFVEGGRIELGGQLPVNTHGGMLSYNAGPVFHAVEAVRQLRGEAGDRQVEVAPFALVQRNAAILSDECTLILGRD